MAQILPKNSLFFSILIVTVSCIFLSSSVAGEDNPFVTQLKRKPLREKLSHFRVYWHDILGSGNATSLEIVKPPPSKNLNAIPFGQINMIDNPITMGPELSSKVVGKSQGFYAVASQESLELLMTMNWVFIEGKYNGSTISILGRNAIFDPVREMAVIGGSGLFRFARGYAQARTYSFDLKTGSATVEYNVYVMHY